MQNKPLLSIVTSIYNGGDNLKGFIQCLSNQTYENLEVVFIEDCSTDDKTIQLIKDLEEGKLKFNKPFKLIRNDKNLGLFKSFQKGLDNATGEYVAFPESDDFLDLDFYETLMNEILRYKNVDAVRGLMINRVCEDRKNKNLLYNNEMSKQECENLELIQISDKMALPIPVKSSTGQIISYIMPDVTYSWFYVFSKKLLTEGYTKPMFENAILYGFSSSIFGLKYKEARVSLDKASFYYYNAHDIFEEGGIVVPVVEEGEEAKKEWKTGLITDKMILEKILDRYQKTIEEVNAD